MRNTKVLWDKGNWFVVTDTWTKDNSPTASIWHKCKDGHSHSVFNEEPARCQVCNTEVPKEDWGFFLLIRYGQENQ
jgi:hypothetical protein